MCEKTRLYHTGHGTQLLVDLISNVHDVSVHCDDGAVATCSLVLAGLSPVLRSAMLLAEEPCIILPGFKVQQLVLFLQCLTTTGSLEDHKEIMSAMGVHPALLLSNKEAAIKSELQRQQQAVTQVEKEEEEGSELWRTAQNLPLLSPLTWRRTTLQLANTSSSEAVDLQAGSAMQGSAASQSSHTSGSTGHRRASPCRSLATFAVSSDTDGFNERFSEDKQLRARVDLYIGQVQETEEGARTGSYVCKLAGCTYSNRKRVLLKYHVLAHLNVQPFNRLYTQVDDYVQFVKKHFKKNNAVKASVKTPVKASKKAENIEKMEETSMTNPSPPKPIKITSFTSLAYKSQTETKLDHAPIAVLPHPQVESGSLDLLTAVDPLQLHPGDVVDTEQHPTKPEPGLALADVMGTANPLEVSHEDESVHEQKDPCLKQLPTKKKIRLKKTSKTKEAPSLSSPPKKKYKMDNMSEETKQKCDHFILFMQNTREYMCMYPNCNYTHRSKTWLKYHVMKHLDITEFLCEECGEAFPMAKLLRKHVLSIHGSDELRAAIEKWIFEDTSNPSWYRCSHPQCGFAAATKKGAGLHALNEHMDKSFICDLCGEGFVTERALHNHTNYHHGNGPNAAGGANHKLYPCSFCQKSFRTASYLDAHENEHKGVRPYQCDACGKSFASNGMLRSHKFAHAPKIFKCDCCDQAFPRKNTLMVHLRAVHMHEKPYECDICGQKFPRSSSMTRHRRIHTGLPRYQCHYCDKTTTQRGDLNRHMAKVHGWPNRDFGHQQQQQQQQQPLSTAALIQQQQPQQQLVPHQTVVSVGSAAVVAQIPSIVNI